MGTTTESKDFQELKQTLKINDFFKISPTNFTLNQASQPQAMNQVSKTGLSQGLPPYVRKSTMCNRKKSLWTQLDLIWILVPEPIKLVDLKLPDMFWGLFVNPKWV